MLKYLFCLMLLVSNKPKVVTYYIVRHAEKVTTVPGDVPLTAEGQKRAEALKELLEKKGITAIYSTPFQRTRATVAPLSKATHIPVQNYEHGDTTFYSVLKKIDKGAVVIAGHSDTVDDIANALAGHTVVAGNLPETAFGDLFIVTITDGHASFQKKHFGK
jgi:2,3-bisphosphoglycerate-dependent phosphoglycerate mutase